MSEIGTYLKPAYVELKKLPEISIWWDVLAALICAKTFEDFTRWF